MSKRFNPADFKPSDIGTVVTIQLFRIDDKGDIDPKTLIKLVGVLDLYLVTQNKTSLKIRGDTGLTKINHSEHYVELIRDL